MIKPRRPEEEDVVAILVLTEIEPLLIDPEHFRKYMKVESEKWAKLVQTARIKPE